jgi:hypothetical protein
MRAAEYQRFAVENVARKSERAIHREGWNS